MRNELVQHLVWHSSDEEEPTENSVVLVRGEMKGNGRTSEFYVFVVENGELTTAETGKPVKKIENFKDYIFTHWAYIPDPI